MADHNIGKVVQVIGPVLDVEFESEHLPEIFNEITIDQLAEGGTQVKLAAAGVESELHIVGRKGTGFFRYVGAKIASSRIDIGDKPSAQHGGEDRKSVV